MDAKYYPNNTYPTCFRFLLNNNKKKKSDNRPYVSCSIFFKSYTALIKKNIINILNNKYNSYILE